MPTPAAHGLAGYALVLFFDHRFARTRSGNLFALLTGAVFGSLADADFIVAALTTSPMWQHHYFSHSIPFALGTIPLCFLLFRTSRFRPFVKKSQCVWRFACMLGAVYSTHLLLDYFTQDSSIPVGIPLFWPFSHDHFIAPVEIFYSIHRGSVENLFGPHNRTAFLRELAVMAPVALIAYVIARARKEKC